MNEITQTNIAFDTQQAQSIIQFINMFSKENEWPIEQIIKDLSITETTCQQYINFLQECGAPINRNHNKIYYDQPPKIISSPNINWLGDKHHFLNIDSTSSFLKAIKLKPSSLTLCHSEYQYAGRGQRQRQWHSVIGENLSLSIGTSWHQCPTGLISLSQALGAIVIRALSTINLDQNLSLKYPNDIMHQGKKLGGILVEIQTRGNLHQVVMGVGLNINMQEHQSINQPWTSLSIINQQLLNRQTVLQSILDQIQIDWQTFSEFGFSAFKDTWAKLEKK